MTLFLAKLTTAERAAVLKALAGLVGDRLVDVTLTDGTGPTEVTLDDVTFGATLWVGGAHHGDDTSPVPIQDIDYVEVTD